MLITLNEGKLETAIVSEVHSKVIMAGVLLCPQLTVKEV